MPESQSLRYWMKHSLPTTQSQLRPCVSSLSPIVVLGIPSTLHMLIYQMCHETFRRSLAWEKPLAWRDPLTQKKIPIQKKIPSQKNPAEKNSLEYNNPA